MSTRKRVGVVAGAGMGAAAAVALRRRWSRERKQGPVDVAPPGELGERFLRNLSEAVRIRTVSDREQRDLEEFDRFGVFLETTYPLVHSHLKREVVAGHSLLFTWEGRDPGAEPLALLAHQDVVPVEAGTEDEWELPPFAGASTDEYLFGRGTLDDKGSLIAIFAAVESLLAEGFRPLPTIYLVLGHDEETGGTGAQAVAALFEERGINCSLVLDEGGAIAVDFLPGISSPLALIGIGEKGYVDIEVSATGAGGHSSAPPPSTAIGALAAAISAIETTPMPARLAIQSGLFDVLADLASGPRGAALRWRRALGSIVERQMARVPVSNAMIRTTSAVTMVGGGVKPNVLPQSARAVVNFRILPGDTIDDVLQHVRALVPDGIEVSVSPSFAAFDPPALANPESRQFALVERAARSVFEIGAAAPWILTGATDARHFGDVAAQVLRFVPFTVTAEDAQRFHGTGERIRRADANAAVEFYRTLLQLASEGV